MSIEPIDLDDDGSLVMGGPVPPYAGELIGWLREERQRLAEERSRMNRVLIKRVREDALVPKVAYEGDAGLDLAILDSVTLFPGAVRDLATGLAVALPPRTFGWIVSRSSTIRRHKLFVHPAVIDNGWRGELNILVQNTSDHPQTVLAGTRLAQMIMLPCMAYQMVCSVVDTLPGSARGTNGYGSSGV